MVTPSMSSTTPASPAGEPLDVGVARFSGVDDAERAFADARERDPGASWIADTAFVEVHRNGRIAVRGSVAGRYVDLDGDGDADPAGRRTGIGAVAGAAAGLLLGPSAFAVGLVGGAVAGGAAEAAHVPRPAASDLDAIHLPKGSSALVVVSDAERVRAMREALAAAAETVERHRLGPADAAALHSLLEEAPQIARTTTP